MKKFTSLQFMMLMSLAVGSSFVTECYGGSDKYADKSEKLGKSKKSKPVAKKDDMKCIERELRQIRRDFKKSGNRKEALERLRALEPRIEKLIACLKQSEKHGKIWETHEHTLNRKLRETRQYVKDHAKKDKVEMQSHRRD